MHYVSLCAILRDEALYVEEWVKYHFGIGVDHFYLYENDSKDNTLAVLHTLEQHYPITIYNINGAPVQLNAYFSCLQKHRYGSRWIGFLDIDEFIVPKIKPTTNIKVWLKNYEHYPGVAMHWKLFGSNGRKLYSPEPVVERFTKRQNDGNPHFKCFIDPTRAIEPLTPHRFRHTKTAAIASELVDEHKNIIGSEEVLQWNGTTDLIQVNHYATKSMEECLARRVTPRADTGEKRNIDEFFKSHDRNETEDLLALNIWRTICGLKEDSR